MHKLLVSGVGLLALGLVGAVVPGQAQNAGKDQGQAGPTGSVGSSWSSSVSKDGSKPDITLDSKQMEAVKKVSAYFNELANLRGTFVQTDPDKKKARGKFYV